MRKDNLYFLTFTAISIIYLLIASFGVKYLVNTSANQLIKVQLESSKREANEIAKLIHHELKNGISSKLVIQHLQETIENTHTETYFICLFNWSGKEICHPDKTKVGQQISTNQELLNALNEEKNKDELYNLLIQNNTTSNTSEIVFITPVKDSDLLVAAHANTGKISAKIKQIRGSFYIIFTLMGLAIILTSFFAVRIIGSHYEKKLELKNTSLETELLNLSKLNTDLVAYKQKLNETTLDEETPESLSEASKKRILTYKRNELIPISTSKISHIYTENTITYVANTNGEKSTSNMSLDDIYADLDTSLFFRANRQFIISITAIEKIIKYGNSQLKILVQSDTSVEIIISKNKAAEFKQWLNS